MYCNRRIHYWLWYFRITIRSLEEYRQRQHGIDGLDFIRNIQYDFNNLDIRRYIRIVEVRGVFFLICLDVTKFPLVMRVSYCSKSYFTSFIHIFLLPYILRQFNQCKNNENFHWKKHFTKCLKSKNAINKNLKLHDISR